MNLRNADAEGDALEGATVTLYSDAAGTSRISGAQATTDAEGVARLHFARAGATGHTAYASVTAPDGFGVGGDRQMVQWDAQSPEHQAENSQHVLNLNATFPFEGKTITTELGGGVALAGWAINVTHVGDDGKHEAVEGDSVPSALDADGKGKIEMSAAGVADLPMTYYVALADDQSNTLDGGEKYETVDTITAVHDGLSVESTKETGTLEAHYTTATIKIYVHQEVDQVPGYTGGIRGGDERISNILDIHVLHIADNGRARPLPASEKWSRPEKDGFVRYSGTGLVTFRNVPTQYDIVVSASRRDRNQKIIVLEPEEVPTYTALEENGVKDGAFGEQGGFHHTVELCPLQAVDPTGQHFGECASFAFVNTYAVSGQAWRRSVRVNADNDGFTPIANQNVPGTTVTVSKVPGSNIAGETNSFTAAASNNPATEIDESRQFNFGQMAQGVYAVKLPDGWTADVLEGDRANTLKEDQFSLVRDTEIDVTPSTGTLYGRVVDGTGAPVSGATVKVNNVSDTTDIFGRYIIDRYEGKGRLSVEVSSTKGFDTWKSSDRANRSRTDLIFAANNPVNARDIVLTGATEFTWINGTVRTPAGDPVAGAEIQVRYAPTLDATANATPTAPLNADSRVFNRTVRTRRIGSAHYVLRTGADGTFRAKVLAGTPTAPQPVRISVRQAGSTVIPYDGLANLAIVGTELSAPFTAFANPIIRGTVWGPDRKPLKDVTVTVRSSQPDRPDGRATAYTTGATGIFIVNASSFADNITVTPTRHGYTISPTVWTGRVTQGQTLDLDGTSTNYFTGSTLPSWATRLRSVAVANSETGSSIGLVSRGTDGIWRHQRPTSAEQVTVVATPAQDNATAKVNGTDANAGAAGHQVNLEEGTNTFTITVTNGNNQDTHTLIINRGREVNRPSAPRNLGATSPGSGQLRFTWQAPADGSSLITGYQWRIKNGSRPVSAWDKISSPTPNNGDGYVLPLGGDDGGENGLVDGLSNIIEIRATTAASDAETNGSKDQDAAAGHIASLTATSWPEIATVELDPATATEGTTESVTLNISTGDEGAAFSDYHVVIEVPNAVRHLVSFPNTVLISASQTSVPVTVRVLDDNRSATSGTTTEVQFTVRHQSSEAARRPRADDTDRATLTITDDDLPPSAPAASVEAGNGLLIVTWTPPRDNAAGITHYQVRVRPTANATGWIRGWRDVPGGATARAYTITGLTNGTPYIVQVRAVSNVGAGAQSPDVPGTPTSG